MINLIKTWLLAILLLGVFSLPTLTATQLVGVLGEKIDTQKLITQVVTNQATVVRKAEDRLTISFTELGQHSLLKIINSTAGSKSLKVIVRPARDGALLSEVVDLTSSQGDFRLFDHSVQPFNDSYILTILPWQSIDLGLRSSGGQGSPGYGTFDLTMTEL